MLDNAPTFIRRAPRSTTRAAITVCLQLALASAAGLVASSTYAQEELEEAPEVTLQAQGAQRLSPQQSDKKARELFEKGRAAWDEGRYREAWEYWHQSYRLSRKPELLYNVGQAADRLRMDREALEAFRLYLAKNPNAPNRREVENRIRILEREVDSKAIEERPDHLSEGLDDEPPAPAPSAGSASDGEPETEGDAPGALGQPERKGLYLRGNLGFGLWSDSASDTAGQSASIRSLTFVIDAKVGYGVSPAFVLGGGLLLDFALGPEVTGGNASGTDLRMGLSLLSVFGDYYIEPQASGFRLFAGLGLGRLAISGGGLGNEDAGGVALYAGGGYELPLDKELALGVDARILVGRFSNDTRDHTLLAPAITASIVWY